MEKTRFWNFAAWIVFITVLSALWVPAALATVTTAAAAVVTSLLGLRGLILVSKGKACRLHVVPYVLLIVFGLFCCWVFLGFFSLPGGTV